MKIAILGVGFLGRKLHDFFSKKYANIKLINHNKRYGVSRSRNDGIKKACGKYIIFGAIYPGDNFTIDSHDLTTKCLQLFRNQTYVSEHFL